MKRKGPQTWKVQSQKKALGDYMVLHAILVIPDVLFSLAWGLLSVFAVCLGNASACSMEASVNVQLGASA